MKKQQKACRTGQVPMQFDQKRTGAYRALRLVDSTHGPLLAPGQWSRLLPASMNVNPSTSS